MDTHENNKELAQRQSCGCGCSATDSERSVEQVQTYNEASARQAYTPAVDIVDANAATTLIMDLPGVAESNLDISIEKNVMTVKGRQTDSMQEGKQLVYSEYGTGEYHRSFVLSEDIDKDGITATLKDGVLQVKLPKQSPVTKKIAVGS